MDKPCECNEILRKLPQILVIFGVSVGQTSLFGPGTAVVAVVAEVEVVVVVIVVLPTSD